MATMDYDRFLSESAKERQPQAIRTSYEKMMRSGLDPSQFTIMAGGMPNDSLFPFVSAEIKLRDGSTLTIDEKNMAAAQQYGSSTGHPPFLPMVREFLQTHHNPPTSKIPREEGGFDFCMTPGAQSGLEMCLNLLLNPGDNYIVEEPTYVGVFAVTNPFKCKPLPVASDDKGIIPSELRKLLERWGPAAAKDPKSDIPKCLYIVPTGTNPGGVTIPEERRREIYQVAREYDLMIIEDDPYYFINFAEERPPTFLSMDVDGRVIRLDSFSKIIAAGLRVGVASGPEPIIRRITWCIQASVGQASSFSQVMIMQLLEKWGPEGFKKQQDRCRQLYMEQRDLVSKYANKHLKGLAEWVEPSAGMFLWLKINGIEDTNKFIEGTLAKQRVLFAPGFCFMTNPDKPSSFMRASFSNVNEEKMDRAFRCLAVAIREELESKENEVR